MGCAFVEKGGTDPAVNIAMGKFGEQFVLNVDILITEKKTGFTIITYYCPC